MRLYHLTREKHLESICELGLLQREFSAAGLSLSIEMEAQP